VVEWDIRAKARTVSFTRFNIVLTGAKKAGPSATLRFAQDDRFMALISETSH